MDPITKRIIQYETVLSKSVWTKTPLLKIFAERLRGMLDRLKSIQQSEAYQASNVTVFIHLYHQQGSQLTIWEEMIKQIQSSVERRPIYFSLPEAKRAIQDGLKEGIVIMDMPKQSILVNDGKRYLKPEDVKILAVKGFYWGGKLFHFSDLSLKEMNSEFTD